MKRIILALALMFCGVQMLLAQKTDVDQLFEKYKDKEEVTTIVIAKPMFKMLNKLNIADADFQELKPILEQINGMKIMIVDNSQEKGASSSKTKTLDVDKLQSEINETLKNLSYEELMTVNNKDSKVKILSADALDGVLKDVLLNINTEGSSVLMFLDGKISMDAINQLTDDLQASSKESSQPKSAAQKVENRKVGAFQGIEVSNSIMVNFTSGSTAEVKVTAKESHLEYIKTEVQNGILKVFVQNGSVQNLILGKIVVDITAPQLNSVAVSSGGNFKAQNRIIAEKFSAKASSGGRIMAEVETRKELNLDASSGGEIALNLKANMLKTNATSGANLTLKGEVHTADYQISSAGKINARELKTDKAKVEASSAASITLHAIQSLDANVSTTASVKYIANETLKTNIKSHLGTVESISK